MRFHAARSTKTSFSSGVGSAPFKFDLIDSMFALKKYCLWL